MGHLLKSYTESTEEAQSFTESLREGEGKRL
jgi:hypothetical protein